MWVFICRTAAATAPYFDRKYEVPLVGPRLTLAIIDREAEKFASIESFLEWVAKEYPSFMGSFTFLRRSESLQGASGVFPRAIVYGHDARLLMTFNGDATQAGFDRIELIESRGSHWEFREIVARDGLKVSPPNPDRCLQCHTTFRHPLWDEYSIWKRAFGKHDDTIADLTPESRAKMEKEPWMADRIIEADEYEAFLAIKDAHPRYKWLTFPKGSEISPYNYRGTNEEDYRLRPNLRLTNLLSRHHAEAIVARLQTNDCYRAQKHALLATLLKCEIHDEFNADLAVIDRRVLAARRKRFPGKGASSGDVAFRTMGNILELMEMERADFSLATTPDYKYFEGGYHLNNRVLAELYRVMGKDDKNLTSVLKKFTYAYSLDLEGTPTEPDENGLRPFDHDIETKVCRHLITHAKRDSFAACEMRPALKRGERPLTVRICASCHETREPNVPPIDFSRLDAGMRARILERIGPRAEKRMPPLRALSDRERQEVETYLQIN